ncbi:MAG: inositol monophosphatase family protein [Desulfurococcaceae archaeon]
MKHICTLFREISNKLVKLLRENRGKEEYYRVVGRTVGGDNSRLIDLMAEDYFTSEVEKLNLKAWIVGEERGLRRLVSDPEYIILVDPLDGSLNYISNIPFSSVSIAIYHYNSQFTNSIYGIVQSIFSDDTIEICQGSVLYRGAPIESYIGGENEVISIYTENPRDLEILQKTYRDRSLHVKKRTMGSAALEAAYAAIGFIGGFIHLTGKLRNSDVSVALVIANKLGAKVVTEPSLRDIKIDNIQQIHRVFISSVNSPIWSVIDELGRDQYPV